MRTKRIFAFILWTGIFSLSALLLWNSRGYFSNPQSVAFYRERIPEVPPVWRYVLIPHVLSGMICLLTGPFLFLSFLNLKGTAHAVLGCVYACSTLGIMLPTGIWLSFYAHGGWAGRTGFLFTGLWMGMVTLLGLYALRRHHIRSHTQWMIRSYALALSALTFRLVYLSGYYVGLSYEINYPLSTWVSTLLNLCLAETIVRLCFTSNPQPYLHGKYKHEKNNAALRIMSVTPAHPSG